MCPNLAGLRYAGPGAPTQGARLIVPLTFMRKGTLKGFDMTDGAGHPAPTVGRSEYGALLVETLLFEVRVTDAAAAGQGDALRKALNCVVDADPAVARSAADELVDQGTYGRVPCLDPQKLTDYAAGLIHKLAEWYVLIALQAFTLSSPVGEFTRRGRACRQIPIVVGADLQRAVFLGGFNPLGGLGLSRRLSTPAQGRLDLHSRDL